MQRVQTFIFTPEIVFVWRFTRRRVLLAILEWERVFPVRGPRSQASQRRAIAIGFFLVCRDCNTVLEGWQECMLTSSARLC